MKISKMRSILYGTAKFLGDVDAVKKGKVKQRIHNRLVGKATSKVFKRK